MNPRAPQQKVHFGEVPLKDGSTCAASTSMPSWTSTRLPQGGRRAHDHDHVHGEDCDHPSHAHEGHGHHHHHDDDVKSFVYRSDRAFDPRGSRISWARSSNLRPAHAALQGRPAHAGHRRKVIFQGVHQLMGSDLGPAWAPTKSAPAAWCSSASTCRARSWNRAWTSALV
jgi:G3E family GTPase